MPNEYYLETRVARVYLKRRRGTPDLWIVPICPYCGGKHTYNAGPEHGDLLDQLASPAVVHCYTRGLYKLVPFDAKTLTRRK